MEATRYRLGVGLAGNLLVLAMLVAASGYFLNAAMTAVLEPLVIARQTLGGPDLTRVLLYALSALFGAAALFLVIKIVRNLGLEEYVLIDRNRIVVSGQSLEGGERTVSHSEVVRVVDHVFRGMPAVELVLRDGSKLGFASVQFGSREKYQAFRAQLEDYLPASHTM